MNLNVIYDSSVGGAPAAFRPAVSYVVNYLESVFSNPVTVNIAVGWGEVDGQNLGSGTLGASITNSSSFTYSQIKTALSANTNKSAADLSAVASLASDPTNGTGYYIATANARALGLMPANGSGIDGWVGFSNSTNFAYDPNNRGVPGTYDFIGVAFHEITEVMGRTAGLTSFGYTVLDLFRYSAAGVHQLTGGLTAYFSVDGGNTSLDNFNTNSGGDDGDWASSAGSDAFRAFSSSGVTNAFSTADTTVMDAIGWNVSSGNALVSITTSGTGITTGAGNINAGKVVTLTLSMSAPVVVAGGVPTLTLNDGGTAIYSGGSGTTALTFSYTVLNGQNTPDLTIASMSLNGGTIRDGAANSVDLSAANNYNPAGTLKIDTTTPIVTISNAGGTVHHTAVSLTGTVADADDSGGTVSIFEGSASLGTAAVASNGTWSANIALSGQGSHTLVAKETDAAGNLGTSNAVTFILDSTPIAQSDSYIVRSSTVLAVSAAAGVLANDNDFNGLSLSATLGQSPSHGNVVLHQDGSFIYAPATSFVGMDSFTYTASDALQQSSPATVNIVVGSLDALTTAAQKIAELYVGYFNRAPDTDGLNYWLNAFNTSPAQSAGGSNAFYNNIAQIAASFADPSQTETGALYPFLAHPQQSTYNDVVTFVDSAYQNLFNRAADPIGESYWATSIARSLGIAVPVFNNPVIDGTGPVTASVALLAIIMGAQANDAATIADKVVAGLYYESALTAHNIPASSSSEHLAIAGVTYEPSTVLAAEATTNSYVQSYPTTSFASASSIGVLGIASSADALLAA